MPNNIAPDKWIYVLVEVAGNTEQVVGRHDTERDIRFIPIFLERDIAQLGAIRLALENKFEIQAMLFEDLLQYASSNQSLVFVMNQQGAILTKMTPDGKVL